MPFRSPKRWASACSRRADGPVAAGVALAALTCAAHAAAQSLPERQGYVSALVGKMTDNEWGEIFEHPTDIDWLDAQFLGANLSWEWGLGRWGYVGAEAQMGRWFGGQENWELTVPVFYRTPRPESPVLPSLAYGLGLSLASAPSQVEIDRTGESTEVLAHWFFEAEFGNAESAWKPFVRLHHRSHAWEAFDARTGSNALLFGIRWTR